jgi:hypothetical protein
MHIMIRIEIQNTNTRRVEGVSKKTGKPFLFFEQEGYAFVADRDGKAKNYPDACKFTFDDLTKVYQPGVYTLAPGSIWVDKFGSLNLSPKLTALQK